MTTTKLHSWRVLYVEGGTLFVAQGYENHPKLGSDLERGILTSQIVQGEFAQGEICQTRSGTQYVLCKPIEPGEAADELARHMLLRRVGPLVGSEEDIAKIYALIDDILNDKYAPSAPTLH